MLEQSTGDYARLTMDERRKLARFAVSAPVRLTLGSGDSAQEVTAYARDLSAAGAYIFFNDSRVDVGDQVDIEIRLTVTARKGVGGVPLEIPMTGHAEVRRIDPDGVALVFDHRLRFS